LIHVNSPGGSTSAR